VQTLTYPSIDLFFGGANDSHLDRLKLQLVKCLAEIMAHGVHNRDGVRHTPRLSRSCVLLGIVAARSVRGATRAYRQPKRKSCLQLKTILPEDLP